MRCRKRLLPTRTTQRRRRQAGVRKNRISCRSRSRLDLAGMIQSLRFCAQRAPCPAFQDFVSSCECDIGILASRRNPSYPQIYLTSTLATDTRKDTQPCHSIGPTRSISTHAIQAPRSERSFDERHKLRSRRNPQAWSIILRLLDCPDQPAKLYRLYQGSGSEAA